MDTQLHAQVVAFAAEPVTAPFVLGTAFTTALLGVTLNQSLLYWGCPYNKNILLQLLVVVAVALDVFHTGLCQVTVWKWFVQPPKNLANAGVAPWTCSAIPFVSGLSAFLVHMFFATSIAKRNSRYRNLLFVSITFGTLCQLTWATIVSGNAMAIGEYTGLHAIGYMFKIWVCSAALTNALITVYMSRVLLQYRKLASSQNNLLIQAVNFLLETNAITLLVAVLDIILLVARDDAVHVTSSLCLSKLYAISLLVCLNSKTFLRVAKVDGRNKKDQDLTKKNEPEMRLQANFEVRPGVHVLTTATVRSQHLSNSHIPMKLKSVTAPIKSKGRSPMPNRRESQRAEAERVRFCERFPMVSLALPASCSTNNSSKSTYSTDREASSDSSAKAPEMMTMRPDVKDGYTATITGGIHEPQ